MGCVVWCAEMLCPEGRKALRLIASGEEGELMRCRFVQFCEPADGCAHGLFPADLLVFARSTGTDTFQRLAQARRRVDLHDPGRAFGAKNPLVHRVVTVAFDIGDFAVLHVHVDPAAAGAHVACGLADLVRDLGGCVDVRLLEWHLASSLLHLCEDRWAQYA